MRATDGRLFATLFACVDLYPSPGAFAGLILTKLAAFWSGYEAPNNLDPAALRDWLVTPRLFPFSSFVLLPLGAVGALASLEPGRLRRRWPALAGLAVVLASCLAGQVLARYRLPALPFVALFAAVALDEMGRAWHEPRRRAFVGVLLLAAFALAWPRAGAPRTVRLLRLATLYGSVDKLDQAKDLARDAIDASPAPRGSARAVRDYWRAHRFAKQLAKRSEDAAFAAWLERDLARRLAEDGSFSREGRAE